MLPFNKAATLLTDGHAVNALMAPMASSPEPD